MRDLKLHIIHCSDTPDKMGVHVKDIDVWHKDRGFDCIGYHFVILQDGTIELGRPLDVIGAHCKGFNSHSVGTCLIGRDEFTQEQYNSLRIIDEYLKLKYNVHMDTMGHCELNKHKTCPNFSVKELTTKWKG